MNTGKDPYPTPPGEYYREAIPHDPTQKARCGWYNRDPEGDPTVVLVSLKRQGDLFIRHYRVTYTGCRAIIDDFVNRGMLPTAIPEYVPGPGQAADFL